MFENLDSGEVLCAACPNARVLVTAGTSTVCIHCYINTLIYTHQVAAFNNGDISHTYVNHSVLVC